MRSVRLSPTAGSSQSDPDSAALRLARSVVTDPIGLTCLLFLIMMVLAAIFAPLLAPYDPIKNDLSNVLASPSTANWFGTDELGRDVLSRLLFAARVSLLAALMATAVAVVIGFPFGLLAGYAGGRTDRVLIKLSDGLMSLPGLIIILAVIAVFGPGLAPAMITLGLIMSPSILRIVRGSTLAVRNEMYVDAARVLGLPSRTIIRRHILPHALPPLIVQTSLMLGIALLIEAGLSFIGLGVQPPASSWGLMLARARTYMGQAPALMFPPGIIITLTVLALNLLGDSIRDSLGRGIDKPSRLTTRQEVTTDIDMDLDHTQEDLPEASVVTVRDLVIGFPGDGDQVVEVVSGVSFDIGRGETLGLVGESGCGKTVTARALLGLVPSPGGIVSGSISFDGFEVVGRSERELRPLRGAKAAMIFQDPSSSLDPAYTVGNQIAEGIRTHRRIGRSEAWAQAVDLLEQVGIADANRRVFAYPHEFSGGMAQRVMIAAALASDPDLLIADEPTTALDVTVQAEILELLRSIQTQRDMSVLFVTHDLGVVADLCHRVIIMYAGEIAEVAPAGELFRRPHHPYTSALLASVVHNRKRSGRLESIPGTVPAPQAWPVGCRFAERCSYVIGECRAAPIVLDRTDNGQARCIRSNELVEVEAL